MNSKIHTMRLRSLISTLTDKIIDERILNDKLGVTDDSVYIQSIWDDIESLQVAIILLEKGEG